MDNKYTVKNLVKVAKRENNSKRAYLYVNPIQGKHIPVEPNKPIELYKYMASMLDREYAQKKVLIIGFAETATAIGTAISVYSDVVKYCTQTTREVYQDVEYLYFSESHSHAAEQSLIVDSFDEILNNVDCIVFAEDEVTTGNTICKLITQLQRRFEDKKISYGIISILNSMSSERIYELQEQGIICQYVQKIPYEYNIDCILDYSYNEPVDVVCNVEGDANVVKTEGYIPNLRFIQNKERYCDDAIAYVRSVVKKIEVDRADKKVLVLGVEEFMYLPMLVAETLKETYKWLDVKFHATTRSPILTSKDSNYPLFARWKLSSPYDDERVTYVYNLDKYDYAIVLSDSECQKSNQYSSIIEALLSAGCKKIFILGKEAV